MRLEVDKTYADVRLDRFLASRVPHMGRAKAKRWIAEGWARVNGARAKKSHRLEIGDVVVLERLPDAPDFEARPEASAPLEVLYEDEDCVVIAKPAGIPTHPLSSDEMGTVANALVARYPEMAGVGYRKREPGLLHRLDTNTSGVLLAARTTEAFDELRERLEQGAIDKRYMALCDGRVSAPDEIEFAIAHSGAKRMRACRNRRETDKHGGREATTEVLASEPLGRFSWVEVRARRARRHQVRVHLACVGYPLVGDTLYDGPSFDGLEGHFLHASRILIDDIDVTAPLPADRAAILERLRAE